MKEKIFSDVSVVRCSEYSPEKVLGSVRRAVDLLGGMSAFVRPGSRVLIKPNLLKASAPEAAVVTHPEMIRAVVRLVREAGADAWVGDSPGFGELRRVCEKSGVMDIIREEGAGLADMDEAVMVRNSGQFHYFEIARAVREADVVINLPKFKTHGMVTLTGAIKNLFGCIPGKRKVQWHFNAGIDRAAFARMLVELCALIRPQLTIMDAIIGMEGNGPGSGSPRKIGLVLAGRDPVAVDVVSGKIAGADSRLLPVVRAAIEAGFGEASIDKINLLGDSLEAAIVADFILPPQEHTEWRLPEWVRRLLKDSLTTRPVVNSEKCIECNICGQHCPQGAISNGGKRIDIAYRKCIRCFCCQEFCPQGAITVGQGWALKIAKLLQKH